MKKIIIGIVIVCIVALVGYLLFSQNDNDYNEEEREEGYSWRDFRSGRGNLRAEEIKRIFNENEEAFDYIIPVIKSLGKVGYTIIILSETDEIIIYDPHGNYVTYSEWGLPEDEKFIEYVRQLLIEEQLGRIIIGATEDIDVGSNGQIRYSERPSTRQSLKENWTYAVHPSAFR
jgi:hypothetical protein